MICVQRNIYPCDPSENNDLAEIVKEPDSNEANLILKKLLDAEDKGEHQLVLTLTDNRLGDGNFMTQSLLIIVEDINDNVPIFEVCASYPAPTIIKQNLILFFPICQLSHGLLYIWNELLYLTYPH